MTDLYDSNVLSSSCEKMEEEQTEEEEDQMYEEEDANDAAYLEYYDSILTKHGYDKTMSLLELYRTHKDTFVPILVNECYGGFSLSDDSRRRFIGAVENVAACAVSIACMEGPYTTAVARSDPTMIDIVGDTLEQTYCSNLRKHLVPLFLLKYTQISNHDGYEGIDLHSSEFCMDLLTETCDQMKVASALSDTEKLKAILESREVVRAITEKYK
jgi:hypothetical protein